MKDTTTPKYQRPTPQPTTTSIQPPSTNWTSPTARCTSSSARPKKSPSSVNFPTVPNPAANLPRPRGLQLPNGKLGWWRTEVPPNPSQNESVRRNWRQMSKIRAVWKARMVMMNFASSVNSLLPLLLFNFVSFLPFFFPF